MSDGWQLALLLAGPAGGAWFYVSVQRRYRNTTKSHDFEHETAVAAKVTGSDRKFDEVKGTKQRRIDGDNAADHRRRL